MVNLFRKLLIRIGKIIPFVFAFIVVISHVESICAILNDDIILDLEGYYSYNVPISNYIGNIVYVDWFDVFLLYILAIALEFCKYNMRAVHFLLLNLFIRALLEHFYLDTLVVVHLCAFMALLGLYCVYGGFKMIPQQKDKF